MRAGSTVYQMKIGTALIWSFPKENSVHLFGCGNEKKNCEQCGAIFRISII